MEKFSGLTDHCQTQRHKFVFNWFRLGMENEAFYFTNALQSNI